MGRPGDFGPSILTSNHHRPLIPMFLIPVVASKRHPRFLSDSRSLYESGACRNSQHCSLHFRKRRSHSSFTICWNSRRGSIPMALKRPCIFK